MHFSIEQISLIQRFQEKKISYSNGKSRGSQMSKRQIFGSIFDVGKLIGFQKNPMIGGEERFGITHKLLGK